MMFSILNGYWSDIYIGRVDKLLSLKHLSIRSINGSDIDKLNNLFNSDCSFTSFIVKSTIIEVSFYRIIKFWSF